MKGDSLMSDLYHIDDEKYLAIESIILILNAFLFVFPDKINSFLIKKKIQISSFEKL